VQFEEIKVKYLDAKVVPGLEWLSENLGKDGDVINETCRSKSGLKKLIDSWLTELGEFLEDPEEDERLNQEIDIFSDDSIAVGPGKDSAGTTFLDDAQEQVADVNVFYNKDTLLIYHNGEQKSVVTNPNINKISKEIGELAQKNNLTVKFFEVEDPKAFADAFFVQENEDEDEDEFNLGLNDDFTSNDDEDEDEDDLPF